jgi:hypothetical protein
VTGEVSKRQPDIGSSNEKSNLPVAETTTLEALQKDSVWISKLRTASEAKTSVDERFKLVDTVDKALEVQKSHSLSDFVLPPAIVAAGAFAAKYKPVLAIGAGAAALVGVKIYNAEGILSARERAEQALRAMPVKDGERFGKFASEMIEARTRASDAYLPFGIYTIASFLPVVKRFTHPAGIAFLGAGALAIDSYQTFVSKPQIHSQFREQRDRWRKEISQQMRF